MAYLASQPADIPVGIRNIAKAAGAPSSYMAKVIRALSGAGLVTSARGKSGGHTLRRAPSQISLLDVVNATDEPKNSHLSNCVMGLDKCTDTNSCALHDIWVEASRKMRHQLNKTTLEDVAGFMKKLRPREKSAGTLSKRVRALFA